MENTLQPGVSYHIDPHAKIELTGAEFIQILNTLNRVLQSPIYQEQLAIANTVASIGTVHELAVGKLKELVETGVATAETKENPTEDSHIMD